MTRLSNQMRWLVIVLVALALVLTVTLWPATAAPDATYHIAFTSDVHGKTANLESWLTNLKVTDEGKTGTSTLDHMVFGGDYEGWSVAETCRSIVTSSGTAWGYGLTDDRVVLVRGNHDPDDSRKAQGLVYDGPGYAIYALDNTDSRGNWSNGEFRSDDIIALDDALARISSGKPVFIAAHHPIHTFGGRSTANAVDFLTVVNKYPNAIVLWGHNHTVSDPWYGQVRFAETVLPGISAPATNFTYANFGAMGAPPSGTDAYGMLATLTKVSEGTKVEFVYKNTSGVDKNKFSVTIPPAPVEVAYSSGAFTGTSSSLVKADVTIPSGADRLMLVGVSWSVSSGASDITSITYGSQSLSQVQDAHVSIAGASGGNRYAAVWALPGPMTDTPAALTITLDGSPNRVTAGIVSVTGADPVDPLGAAKTTSASSGNPSVSVSAKAGGLVLDTLYRGGGTSTVGAGQTSQWTKTDGNFQGAGSTKPCEVAGDVVMEWVGSGNHALVAVPINPADGSTPPVVTHTIRATAGPNGTISPSGEVSVEQGADKSFTITPASGYQVADVEVDGASVGAVTSYTFTDVQDDHEIVAGFEAGTPSGAVVPGVSPVAVINTSQSSITSNPVTVAKDTLVLVTVVWSSGTSGAAKTIADITFGGHALTLSKGKTFEGEGSSGGARSVGIYPFIAPTAIANGAAVVSFSDATTFSILNVETFTGVDTTDPLGTFSPGATHKDGSSLPSQTLSGLVGDEVVVDLMYQAPHSSYLDPGASQTLLWQGASGSSNRAQSSCKQADGSDSVTMGWTFGSTLPSQHSWTILAVPINPADGSTPPVVTHTIRATAGPNGTISPSGEVSVEQGADKSFTITPASGYQVADVEVDGASVGAVTSYTFTDVQDDHEIVAGFEEQTVLPYTITYESGWNLVAGGPDSDFAGHALFAYDRDAGRYKTVRSEDMKHAEGYWLWLTEVSTAHLNTQSSPLVCQLQEGWNLIGNSTRVDLDLAAGERCFVYGPEGRYMSVDQLRPGEGAWIWSDTVRSIQLTAAGL